MKGHAKASKLAGELPIVNSREATRLPIGARLLSPSGELPPQEGSALICGGARYEIKTGSMGCGWKQPNTSGCCGTANRLTPQSNNIRKPIGEESPNDYERIQDKS
jgi:hypothetical protein